MITFLIKLVLQTLKGSIASSANLMMMQARIDGVNFDTYNELVINGVTTVNGLPYANDPDNNGVPELLEAISMPDFANQGIVVFYTPEANPLGDGSQWWALYISFLNKVGQQPSSVAEITSTACYIRYQAGMASQYSLELIDSGC
ncbi:hypothetical protein [Shewanella marina]|uniref:hypothetical protein n=1 Tax=Shewanella marina TaxID=487319 RepID=UPI00046E542C|nr:hypothetical protein [Shewanella marina]